MADSSPIPVNEFKRVLFAFLNDPLNINGILSFSVTVFNVLAISKVSSLDSITHGPAIRKKVFSLVKFKLLISIISKMLYKF